MNGLDLDDLPRRLADLADAGGPWDDPMPEILRRAAQASAADAELHLNVDRAPVRPRPAAARAKSRWRSMDPFAIVSAAAVLLVVVGLGWLIHGAGSGDSSRKSADSASTTQFGSRAAGGSVPGSSASGGATVGAAPHASSPRSASVSVSATPVPASGCGIVPGRSSALSLRAPATVRTGAVLSVEVRLAGSLAGSVRSQVIVVVARGQVVGRLVPTGAKVGPGAVPAAAVVTGTLRSGTCDLVTPKPGPTPPLTLPGRALAPGRYQLVVVVTSARASTASAAVGVIVTP